MSRGHKILFAVDMLHDYYLDNKCTDFDWQPSPETALLMKQRQLMYKITGNKLVVFGKVDDDNKLLSELDANSKLVFYQRLNNPLFMELSNLNRALFTGKRFYYTNVNQNQLSNIPYLSSPIKNYADASGYATGDFANNGTGIVFEAVQPKTANDSHNTTDTAYWVSKGAFQYANEADMINLVPRVANYTVAANTLFDVNIYTLNPVNNLYDRLLTNYQAVFNEAIEELQVDLRSCAPGKYKVEINGTSFMVYADDNCRPGDCFALVEIFNHLPNGNAFALLDADGKVKDAEVDGKYVWLNFVIRYANRRTFWKYITKRVKPPGSPLINSIITADPIGPASVEFDAFSTDPVGAPTRKDYFVSKALLPLTEATDQNNFEITFVDVTYTPIAAPKPNLTLSGMITKPPNDSKFYCNIFLNY